MTVMFGGAGSSNSPAEESKTKNDPSRENEKAGTVKADDSPSEKYVPLVSYFAVVCNLMLTP